MPDVIYQANGKEILALWFAGAVAAIIVIAIIWDGIHKARLERRKQRSIRKIHREWGETAGKESLSLKNNPLVNPFKDLARGFREMQKNSHRRRRSLEAREQRERAARMERRS